MFLIGFYFKIMIQTQTLLKVVDNSGAKLVKCIKVLGGSKKKFASIGDFLVVSVKELRNKNKLNSKVKKGDVYKAVVVRVQKKYFKKDGSCFNFLENSVCLVNTKKDPIATRIIGPLPKEFYIQNYMKFINISSGCL